MIFVIIWQLSHKKNTAKNCVWSNALFFSNYTHKDYCSNHYTRLLILKQDLVLLGMIKLNYSIFRRYLGSYPIWEEEKLNNVGQEQIGCNYKTMWSFSYNLEPFFGCIRKRLQTNILCRMDSENQSPFKIKKYKHLFVSWKPEILD